MLHYSVGVQTALQGGRLDYSKGWSLASPEENGQLLCWSQQAFWQRTVQVAHLPTKIHLTFSRQDPSPRRGTVATVNPERRAMENRRRPDGPRRHRHGLSPALCEESLSNGYLAVSGLMGHRCGFKLLHGRLEMSKAHQPLAWKWKPYPGSLPWAMSMGNPCNHAQPRELGVGKSEHVR